MTVGLDTTGKITIDGSANAITVNAASGSAAFAVVAGSTAEIDGLTIGGAVTTAGTLTLNGDINPTANNFSVEVLDGGTLYLPTSITLASLTIDAGGFAQQTSTDTTFGSEVLTVGALSLGSSQATINGGVLDLGNGDLIIHPQVTPEITEGETATQQVGQWLAAGYDGGAWDGEAASGPNPAAIVSSAAASDPYQIEALGYAEIGTDPGDLTLSSYDGQSVNTGDAVVALTYYGDCNLDRNVNSADYDLIGSVNSYTNVGLPSWTDGDFNYDGTVNDLDLSLYYGTTGIIELLGANYPQQPGAITSPPSIAKGTTGSVTLTGAPGLAPTTSTVVSVQFRAKGAKGFTPPTAPYANDPSTGAVTGGGTTVAVTVPAGAQSGEYILSVTLSGGGVSVNTAIIVVVP